jgi:hypothetical protein
MRLWSVAVLEQEYRSKQQRLSLFGVEKITFHNYTITAEGVTPKEVNLCTIRNLKIPTDVSMVRAFLGCSQLMSGYCKDLQIISAPLHKLTKKSSAFPKPIR